MEPVTKFVIDRNVWLRGGPPRDSALLRASDGKRCCLGIYLSACGVDDGDMRDVGDPDGLAGIVRDQLPRWMGAEDEALDVWVQAMGVEQLIEINDCEVSEAEMVTEADREARLVELFAVYGIEVEFIN